MHYIVHVRKARDLSNLLIALPNLEIAQQKWLYNSL